MNGPSRFPSAKPWALLGAVGLACLCSGQAAAEKATPYNGREPVTFSTLPNGAVVNTKLADHRFLNAAPRVIKVRDRVWTITGYALSNCTFVETDAGLVVFDTGGSVGQGEYFLSAIRTVSRKPVIAIIYSHSHYVGGASALASGQPTIRIFAHPRLISNREGASLERAPMYVRRALTQFGAFLPANGPDAAVATPDPKFLDPGKSRNGYVEPTHLVDDGETIDIGGEKFVFLWSPADTEDSLTVWIPGIGAVLTNVVSNMFYPMYSLRGGEYRDPKALIQSYDLIRSLRAQFYVPVHGEPLEGVDRISRRLTLHRDAYSFVYNQTIRGINKGLTPDEIVQQTSMPERFREEPTLGEVYSEFDYAIRGVYRGVVGWWAEDTAALNPPSSSRLGAAVVEGFGGMEALVEAADKHLRSGEYDLAATLAGFAVSASPDNIAARQTKADALRALAKVSRGFQSHNFYLTEARALEGQVDRFAPPPGIQFGAIPPAALDSASWAELATVLESRIDPALSAGQTENATLAFHEGGEVFQIQVRDGVAEVTPAPGGRLDDKLSFKVRRAAWSRFLSGRISAAELSAAQGVELGRGSADDLAEFLTMFPMTPISDTAH